MVWLRVLLLSLVLYDLPAQPDLDLPVLPENYKPQPPEPIPTPPPETEVEDPKDEPPPVFYGEEIESENDTLIYVIDVSGSMSRNDKIGRAKLELTRSIGGLTPNIRFNVIAYSCSLASWKPAMVPADDRNKASAIAWSQALNEQGGTGTGPAVALALSDKQCEAVVLLTDGAPSCGAVGLDGHRRMISSANTQAAAVNVFGLDASGAWRVFLLQVAGDGHGFYMDVP